MENGIKVDKNGNVDVYGSVTLPEMEIQGKISIHGEIVQVEGSAIALK